MAIFSSPSPPHTKPPTPLFSLPQLLAPVVEVTTTAPEFLIKLIQSSSPFNINFDRNGEFVPNTSNVLAMAIASWKEWTMLPELDDAAASDDVNAFSLARSPENVGVTAPKERERARRSMEGEEEGDDDGATMAAMVDYSLSLELEEL